MAADPLTKLANALGRPTASLSAFSGLTPEQLSLLTDAIGATITRRQEQVDAELARALPELPRPLMLRLLRGPGVAHARRVVLGRSR